MGDWSRDLEQWVPRLIAVWRRHRNKGGKHHRGPPLPESSLTSDEIREVGAGVKQLSMGLTRNRELAGARYMDDPRLLGAYLLFYWPVSYAQARSTLSELTSRPKSALDLGSGPGPMAFASLDAGAGTVVAADRSKPALELAKTLATEAGEGIATREWSPEKPLPDGQFDLITMGHVVNELFNGQIAPRAAMLEKILERVKPGGSLVVIEPALRDTSRALLQVRDVLVSHGYAVRAPCLWRGACPALIKESDWCHAERNWRMPRLIEDVARSAGLHKESLKMSYLIVAPKGEAWAEPPSGSVFRIVSEALEGKGRQRFMGCGPEGRVGLAMQEKHENEKNRLFFKMSRGDVVRVTNTEERGDGRAVTDQSTLEILASAGQPLTKP
ncbi:MAG: small ribosomal subunit Rsm22 family protein [Archangium sp.]